MAEADSFENDNQVGTGPGQLFECYITMEDALDKLKALNYEKEYVKGLKQKPLTRHYFAIQTNPGEQFYAFASLAAWLVSKCGQKFDQPQEYDDPNSTISTLLDHARNFGATVDFPPNRLKQGCGEHVIYILNIFATQALQTNNRTQTWSKAKPQEEAAETVDEIEDDSELLLEKVEEEMVGMSASDDDADDDDDGLNLDDLRNIQIHRNLLQQTRPEQVLLSSFRSEEWQSEVDRVLPQLRVTVQADAGDWRSHLEQMQKHRQSLNDSFKSTRILLEKIQNDIRGTLEKIDNREKHVNGQLEALLMEYRDKQDELRAISEQYKAVSSGVTDRAKVLAQLSEGLDSVKKETEERSSNMTDGSPLINAKKAVTRLRSELKDVNVRLGVLDNEILQTRLRHKTMDHMEAAEPGLAY